MPIFCTFFFVNFKSSDGYWYVKVIICRETGMTWVHFLSSPADSTKFLKHGYEKSQDNIRLLLSRLYDMMVVELTLAILHSRIC